MAFIMDRPGLTLILVGVVAFLVRNAFGRVPLIGGSISALLLFASVFFVVGGLWMFVVGRRGDAA